jgi:tetratricopeptide (TPR) repeat protein/predicted RNase H-related nuclease YkuK (DUF458 family)
VDQLGDRLKASLDGRYSIEREIGSGGFAKVFLGDDLRHNRKVAIKVLRPELAAAVGSDRFHREIEIAAPLVHPHILPIHNSGEADGLLYYVMPYVEGESLRQRLSREEQLPVEQALAIAREVADGLEYAHRCGVVHRDIKPDNILLTESHAVIVDFGVARAVAAAGAEKLTATGLAIGSPAYMSPEQAGGEEEVDARSDVYALGCVLFEMLTGEPPFTGGAAQALLVRQMVEDPPSLRAIRADITPEVAQTVKRALSKTPDERFGSAAKFAEALGGVQSARAPTAAAVPAAATRMKGWFVGWHRVAIILLLLGVLGTAITLVRERLLEPGSAYAVPNPRRSFVVLPFSTRVPTPEEDSLAARAADELTRQLNGWRSARSVSHVALAGPMFDLGLTGPTLSGLADAIAVAQSVRVGTLVGLTVRVRGDSAFLEADLFDVATSELLEDGNIQSLPKPKDDVYALVAPVANAILGLSGAPGELEVLRRQSDNLVAVGHLQEGLRSLERWRLGEAENHFRAAVDEDSTFALAHHYLGVALYWRVARDWNRHAELGPEIARHSRGARRHAGDLPPNTLTPAQLGHVRAFTSFQEGDYVTARDGYRGLLASDSTDVFAWLLLGSVEYADPWLNGSDEELWTPRKNTNLAVRAFSETVRLSPDFYLGYGHLFDIYYDLLAAGEPGFRGYGFESPRDDVIVPWENLEPTRQEFFYPVVQDSIEWVRSARSEEFKELAHSGAQSLLRDIRRRLERWAAYAPEEPKPQEELAKWHLASRRYMSGLNQAALDRAAEEALRHTAAALALGGDTTPEDLARLGALYLAADSLERAVEHTERALESLQSPGRSLSSGSWRRAGSPDRARWPIRCTAGSSPLAPPGSPTARSGSTAPRGWPVTRCVTRSLS